MPHIHGVVTGGGFLLDREFESAPAIDTRSVREQREKGPIGGDLLQQIKSEKHTGLNLLR